MDFVYLASASPRRRELLRQIGVPFRLIEAAVDESVSPGEAAADYVSRLARAKAAAGCRNRPPGAREPVLAADTAVVLDGRILGKPKHREDGARMLEILAGRSHSVLTAVALAQDGGGEDGGAACGEGTAAVGGKDGNARGGEEGALFSRCCVSRSEVTLRSISGPECSAYWETGEPADKAGGYAIQGLAAVFVTDLRGSFSGVMGLPLYETAQLLTQAGIPVWRAP